ncbi:hypothetical protein JHD48_09795 [Sulfurimonas sp. SAG-AH-194-I05]|nr:hypothetical protein [Sulfurimonas sp. SAG-AH-194-I05]MDF1876028.1 hypothetical protein [Sulfurimonas sp. SAG-AH-194-I05]
MIKNIIKTTVALSLAATMAYGANGARLNVIKGDVGEKYEHLLSESLEKDVGFSISDPHERINDAYAKRYGNKTDPDYDKDWARNLDNLGFFSMTNDKAMHSILKIAPEVAGFAPFNLLAYKKADEDKTYIGHLDPTTMLNIVGTTDKKAREDFIKSFDPLDKWVQDKLGGKVEVATFDALPARTMMQFEIQFERPADLADYIDEFQEGFEEKFEDKKYIIAGYKNYKETYEDLGMDFEEYDAFFVYSLCHFTFSYSIFNKGRPDNGIFAPCSMYMYIKKDTNTLVVGMPTLANWIAVTNIKDPVKIQWVKKIDTQIISLMKELGAKEI